MTSGESPRRTVVVTGAGGYVGRHVVAAAIDLGYDVRAVVRTARADDVDPRATILQADVLSPEFDITAIASPSEVAAVIHLAWQDGFVHNARSHIESVSAHFRFLAGLVDAGIVRIAALGTMHEVGYWEGAITSTTPTNPVTLYGIAKDALRRSLFAALEDRAELLWMRAFYIVGDDRRSRSIFGKILDASDRGDRSFPFTTGRTLYDFIDVDELGRQIALASTADGLVGVINTSSGVPESLADRVERFIVENGVDISLQYGAFPDRPYDSPGVWGDASRIKALIAASPFAKET